MRHRYCSGMTCRLVPLAGLVLSLVLGIGGALAGPPYLADDPEPTEFRHFEIYAYTGGTDTRAGIGGTAGFDFNYGATPDLQLTAVFPVAYDNPRNGPNAAGFGNVELAAKYRFLHQDDVGWDVAIFPRVFLSSPTRNVGDRHTSLLLPIWLERDWGKWSTFGGGGCTLNHSRYSRDFCTIGWALTRQVTSGLRFGAEIVHRSPDQKGGRATTGIGAGLKYDINDHYHLLAYAGPGIQNAAETNRLSWYSSFLFTF